MNTTVIAFCLAVLTASVALSAALWRGADAQQGKARAIEGKVSKLQADVQSLSGLPEQQVMSVVSNYAEVVDCLRMLSRFNDLKSSVVVDGALDGEDISAAAKPSVWPGIAQVSLKVSFTDVAGMDNYIRIFQALNNLKQKYPLNVSSVRQAGAQVDIAIIVFGTV